MFWRKAKSEAANTARLDLNQVCTSKYACEKLLNCLRRAYLLRQPMPHYFAGLTLNLSIPMRVHLLATLLQIWGIPQIHAIWLYIKQNDGPLCPYTFFAESSSKLLARVT